MEGKPAGHGHGHGHGHGGGCVDHVHGSTPYTQSLDELDFQRGTWTAALHGNLARLTLLVDDRGRAPSERDGSGYTPLHYAARNGHLDSVRFLLRRGAEVDAQTSSGLSTPLHRAAFCGHTEIIRALLSRGADPTLADSDGKTALLKAVERKQEEAARVLFEANADMAHVSDKRGSSPASLVAAGSLPALASLFASDE